MYTTKRWIARAAVVALAAPAAGAAENAGSEGGFFGGSELSFHGRLRYESATDELAADADALTLRSALSWRTGPIAGHRAWSGFAQVENTAVLGHRDYTDGTADRGTVMIADPPATELNQLYVSYRSPHGLLAQVGRQRIALGDERFVGAVAFRQNHQSFDALRLSYTNPEGWTAGYFYVANVNRIFGDDADGRPPGQLGDHKHDTHLLNAVYEGWPIGSLEAYAYLIDNDDFPRVSTDTYGMRFSGRVRPNRLTYLYTLEFAGQRSGAGNPVDYDTSYWRVSGGVSYKRLSVQLTQERLGSDNDNGFVTPLATLHKFQGWADKFVVLTPNEGLVDNFITVGGRWPGFRYRIQYHDFDTDVGSRDIGTEFGAALQHRIGQQYLIEFKYADYRAQDGATGPGNLDRDTRRVFLSFSAGFGMSRAR